MRWDGQEITGRDDAALPGLARMAGLVRTVRTPEFAGVTFHEVAARSVLNRVPRGSQMPFEWTVNPMRGCTHACVYCFARATHRYLELDAGRDFDSQIIVKVNAVDVLRRELARPTWGREQVALGTNTDPYQRAEGRYRLMPGIIAALDKKVIVLDLDMRKPKIHKALGTDNEYGMSTILNGQDHVSKAIRRSPSNQNFDFITAGPVPHNPAELIQSDLFYALINELKLRYDYILVDTSPVGLTADAIPLLKIADINLYVIKAGFSKQSFIKVLENLKVKRKINNLYVVLNNYDSAHSSYDNIENSKYYKGYLDSGKKKWWKRNG